MGGEAICFFNPAHSAHAAMYARKQGMQLASKMRFISAQFDALLAEDRWLRYASHANAMAQRLLAGVREIPGVDVTRRVRANAIFAKMERPAIERAQASFFFYLFNEALPEVRWMTHWATSEADIDEFVSAIRARDERRQRLAADAIFDLRPALRALAVHDDDDPVIVAALRRNAPRRRDLEIHGGSGLRRGRDLRCGGRRVDRARVIPECSRPVNACKRYCTISGGVTAATIEKQQQHTGTDADALRHAHVTRSTRGSTATAAAGSAPCS